LIEAGIRDSKIRMGEISLQKIILHVSKKLHIIVCMREQGSS